MKASIKMRNTGDSWYFKRWNLSCVKDNKEESGIAETIKNYSTYAYRNKISLHAGTTQTTIFLHNKSEWGPIEILSTNKFPKSAIQTVQPSNHH